MVSAPAMALGASAAFAGVLAATYNHKVNGPENVQTNIMAPPTLARRSSVTNQETIISSPREKFN